LLQALLQNEDKPEEENPLDRPENIPIDDENIVGTGLLFSFALPFFEMQFTIPGYVAGGAIILTGIILVMAIFGGTLWWKQQNQPESGKSIFLLYERMVRVAGWMGVKIRPWQTAYEYAGKLQRTLPEHSRDVEIITDEYVYQTYSNHKNGRVPAPTQTQPAYKAWNRLRPNMLKQAVKRRVRLPRWFRN